MSAPLARLPAVLVAVLAVAAGLALAPLAPAADASVHADGASATSARWDSARWDSSRWDSSSWDSSRWDSSRWDSSRWDALLLDSSRWDSSRWDSSRWDSSSWDSSRWDGSALVPDPLLAYQWGLADMNVPEAWATTMGSHARTLCVVDTGLDATHPDLAQQYAGGWNFLDGNADVRDGAGHGTHVAGVAAATIGNGYGTAGVAEARVLVAKVLNDQGVGGLGTLAQGIRWCADQGANVVSMSLSTTQDSPALRKAVEYAQAKGALLVASAGNNEACATCSVYPAAYAGVVGVAALGMDRQPAPFSGAGPQVDLIAPGELIAGPYPGGVYALGSGTSQATALVAGGALLVWAAHPELSAAQVAARLQATAMDLGAPGWDAATGFGEPDLARAVR